MMRLPSGDHVGNASQPGSEVNRVVFPLATSISQMSRFCVWGSAFDGYSLSIRRNRQGSVHTRLSRCADNFTLPVKPGQASLNAPLGSRFSRLPGRLLRVNNKQRRTGGRHQDRTQKCLSHCALPLSGPFRNEREKPAGVVHHDPVQHLVADAGGFQLRHKHCQRL